jgi:hypothetical protein
MISGLGTLGTLFRNRKTRLGKSHVKRGLQREIAAVVHAACAGTLAAL